MQDIHINLKLTSSCQLFDNLMRKSCGICKNYSEFKDWFHRQVNSKISKFSLEVGFLQSHHWRANYILCTEPGSIIMWNKTQLCSMVKKLELFMGARVYLAPLPTRTWCKGKYACSGSRLKYVSPIFGMKAKFQLSLNSVIISSACWHDRKAHYQIVKVT